jgi:hypothetical protein
MGSQILRVGDVIDANEHFNDEKSLDWPLFPAVFHKNVFVVTGKSGVKGFLKSIVIRAS